MDISVVIPTKDRTEDLYKCIWSVLNQSVRPAEIIVIDDGCLSKYFIDKIAKEMKLNEIIFKYIKKNTPGLSVSRNMGASIAECQVVLYLDDDVILNEDYIEILKNAWERHKNEEYLGGIGGVIKNLRKITFMEKIFHKIFLLSSPIKWDVTDVGFQVWSTDVKEEQKAYYLPGGITSFRKNLVEKIPFRQLSPGRTPADDVEFFVKTKKSGYYFILAPRAQLFHKNTPVAREDDFPRGIKEGCNQYVIFKDNVAKSVKNYLKFYWSSTGWILRQFLAGHIMKGLGMMAGYIKIISEKKRKTNE